jgi:hypothetical protein
MLASAGAADPTQPVTPQRNTPQANNSNSGVPRTTKLRAIKYAINMDAKVEKRKFETVQTYGASYEACQPPTHKTAIVARIIGIGAHANRREPPLSPSGPDFEICATIHPP